MAYKSHPVVFLRAKVDRGTYGSRSQVSTGASAFKGNVFTNLDTEQKSCLMFQYQIETVGVGRPFKPEMFELGVSVDTEKELL